MKRTKRKDNKKEIKEFFKSSFNALGLKSDLDYQLRDGNLIVFYKKEKILDTVNKAKVIFPMYSFYWDSARMLVWF